METIILGTFGYIWGSPHYKYLAIPRKNRKKKFGIAPRAVPFGSLDTPDTLKWLIFKRLDLKIGQI